MNFSTKKHSLPQHHPTALGHFVFLLFFVCYQGYIPLKYVFLRAAHQEELPELMQHWRKFFILVAKLSPANFWFYLQYFLPCDIPPHISRRHSQVVAAEGTTQGAAKQGIMDLWCPAEHQFRNFWPCLKPSKYRISQSEMPRINWQDFLDLHWLVIPVKVKTGPFRPGHGGKGALSQPGLCGGDI